MSAMLYLVTYHTGDSRTSSEVSDLQRVPDTHFQRSQQTGKGRQKKKGNYEETMGCENGMIWALPGLSLREAMIVFGVRHLHGT